MEIAHRWVDRNLTRLELITAVIIISVLLGLFSRYMFLVFARAERSMMNSTIVAINTAMNYQASVAIMLGEIEKLDLILNMNPMKSVQNKFKVNGNSYSNLNNVGSIPSNYAGEIDSETLHSMEKGKWYYQNEKNILIYSLTNNEFFYSDKIGPDRIHFQVKFDYIDNNNNGKYDKKTDEYKSIKVVSIDNYIWDI